jgi:diguanylate cyclase (GGDEF)-like protein
MKLKDLKTTINNSFLKKNKGFKDIVSTTILPIFAGISFIFWIFKLINHPVLAFPIIAIPIIILYYFSGNIYGGIFTVFAVVCAILNLSFIELPNGHILVIIECTALICLFLILEMFRNRYLLLKNAFLEEHDRIEISIAQKTAEIKENRLMSQNLSEQIKIFREMGKRIQSFQTYLNEKEIAEKAEEIALISVGKGYWKFKSDLSDDKKLLRNDVFMSYVKINSLPLLISNLPSDKRFPSEKGSNKKSLIAAPIRFEYNFFGAIEGSSYLNDFFSEQDLRKLSACSEAIGTALNNARLYKQLKSLSITDSFTGFYTHNYFKERLQEEINSAKYAKIPLSLGILDIDFFKNINDNFGHQTGDNAIRHISSLIRSTFEEMDLIAHYGGEEFAVIFPNTKIDEAKKIAENLRVKVEKEKFFPQTENFFRTAVKITISIGLTELLDYSEENIETFMQRADGALYEAKRSGKNKVVVWKKK